MFLIYGGLTAPSHCNFLLLEMILERFVLKKICKLLNLNGKRGKSKIDLLKTFPLFKPYSSGKYVDRANFTILAINEVIPLLQKYSHNLSTTRATHISISDVSNVNTLELSQELKITFDKNQSDKASESNMYHLLYAFLVPEPLLVEKIFEIGLGTNNTDVVSNMGVTGRPGASLRSFRELYKNAEIHGADVDKRILFEEERIQTFHVDQTNDASFVELEGKISNGYDLMIDDGLHSVNANLRSLLFFLNKIKIGGWAVIEDIGEAALPLWELVGSLLDSKFESYIYTTKESIVFAVKRVK